MVPSPWVRGFIADTVALVLFFTVASGLNERFVAGMPWHDVMVSRMIGAPLMVLTARPYGLWRDWFLARAASRGNGLRLVADAFALMAFQVPIYAAILAAAGAEGAAIGRGVLGFALLMIVLGRPYGFWLDMVRKFFRAEGPGQKPMSLGE